MYQKRLFRARASRKAFGGHIWLIRFGVSCIVHNALQSLFGMEEFWISLPWTGCWNIAVESRRTINRRSRRSLFKPYIINGSYYCPIDKYCFPDFTIIYPLAYVRNVASEFLCSILIVLGNRGFLWKTVYCKGLWTSR